MRLSRVLDLDAAGDREVIHDAVHVLDLVAASAHGAHTGGQSETLHNDPLLDESQILLDVLPVAGRGALVPLAHGLAAGLLLGPGGLALLLCRVVCRHSEG